MKRVDIWCSNQIEGEPVNYLSSLAGAQREAGRLGVVNGNRLIEAPAITGQLLLMVIRRDALAGK